ncbi:MAG TPA: tRNA (adenosine(37)-N6)-threonylcarbamoyltransferase complex dimerization subunit type 1 TsaB [Candidatus Sulfotelmatobacter sp.]|jgi:tRNA threonylcarbamoyladenosine biosynthesis protein TsaB|nr:tRNA (adenosine(37)-N6)-threonylcarbamoyltransferase complex dimerization subunit type 1 TsaB [Candidatus Sulfotelmatobacter sp.]
MRLVAIDTSTWWGGAALVETREGPPRVVAEAGTWVEDSHAARILGLVDAVLALAGWSKQSLDAYAATRGPGSFTGIRVGLGTVAGLALATERACVGVSTLAAMSEAAGPSTALRQPMLDAGRGEVYSARYDGTSCPPRELTAPWVGAPERALLEAGPDAVALFGSGALAHEGRLRAAGYTGVCGPTPTSIAAGAGRIAAFRLAAGEHGEADLVPLYLRPADAELKRPKAGP